MRIFPREARITLNQQAPLIRPGFSLAELLIALLIVGEIAAFSIPKIVSAQQNGRKVAVFKEDIALLHAGLYSQVQQGNLTIGSHACGTFTPINVRQLTQSFLNYTKSTDIAADTTKFYLANGSTITGHKGWHLDYSIDWNGDDGPNIRGNDSISIFFNDSSDTAGCYGVAKGRIDALNWEADYALYLSLF